MQACLVSKLPMLAFDTNPKRDIKVRFDAREAEDKVNPGDKSYSAPNMRLSSEARRCDSLFTFLHSCGCS